MPDGASLICTNPACDFAETGNCVEGNDVSECTFLQEAEAAPAEDESNDETEVSTDPKLVTIGGEGCLSMRDASALMKCVHAPIIAFLGPIAAGKTTLIAEVYDAFQYGQYKTLEFAGSSTLMAFEKISHAARSAARADRPTQERTLIGGDLLLYHLRIYNGCEPMSLMLADRSGEVYRNICDTPALAAECVELQRAVVVNILVDGERLCEPSTRASAISECAQSVQTLILSGVLRSDAVANLVLTKLDFVDGHKNKARAHTDFDTLSARIRTQCGDRSPNLATYKIAACPHTDGYEKGYGVEDLVASWLGKRPVQGVYTPPPPPSPMRSMDRTPISNVPK